MSLTQGNIAIHLHVKLDGVMVSDAACLEVMRIPDIFQSRHHTQNLLFHALRQSLVGKVADAVSQQLERHLPDENAHYHRGYRVEDDPSLTKKDSAADAYQSANRR